MVAQSEADKRAAKRQRSFHSAKDYETVASQLGGVAPLEASTKDKARRQVTAHVAHHVKGSKKAKVELATELMMMLGIHPSQPDFDDGPVNLPGQYNTMEKTSGASVRPLPVPTLPGGF